MFKKGLLIVAVFMLVAAFGAANVFAADTSTANSSCPLVYNSDTGTWVANFCDGRINAFDMTEPVAIYYSYNTIQAVDSSGSTYLTNVVSGINLWTINSNSVGQLALSVPLSQITPAFSAAHDVQIAAANGLTLNYSPSSHMFLVTAPGYSFSWEAW